MNLFSIIPLTLDKQIHEEEENFSDVSDRLYKLLNIFLFILIMADGEEDINNFEGILNDETYTNNFLHDSAVFFVTLNHVKNDMQLWEIYHIKDIRVVRNISPATVTWRSIFDTISQPVSLRRSDFLRAPIVAGGEVSLL